MPAGKEIETEKFRVLELVSVRTGPTPKRVKSTRAGPTGANNADEYLLLQYFVVFLNLEFSDRTSSDTLYFLWN